MFATRPDFKNSFQLDPQRVYWRAMELVSQFPWFIATVALNEGGGGCQSFMLSTDKEVGMFLEKLPAPGRLSGLEIITPASQSPCGQWLISQVVSIERPIDQERRPVTPLVFLTRDGQRYGGFPLECMKLTPSEVEEVVRLSC